MTSISIPAGVERIDPAFFQLFPNAASVTVDAGNSAFTSYNGMLFDADLTDLLLVPEGMEGVAVLPGSLASVPAYVISRCKKLYGLTFSQGSTGSSALAAQDGILYTSDKTTLLAAPAGIGASVALAPECTTIAEGAFWGNRDLKTIISNGRIAEIATSSGSASDEPDAASSGGAAPSTPASAFNPETIEAATVITDERSAWEATGFTHFAEPAKPGDATTIAPDESGFIYTLMEDGHLSVKWAGDAPATGERTIVETATLHGVDYTVTAIEDGAFKDQTELTGLTLPSTITFIGDFAFAGCTALGSIQIPGSTISIGASAFEGCTSLASIALGGGLRTIGERAFAGTALTELILPASVQSIGSIAFAGCEQLRTIVARGTVAHVSETAFADVAGVSIYAPYAEDSDYAWNIGPVASANHLLSYGVRAPESVLSLQTGQEVNLFADDGYLHAPDGVEAQFAYNAKAITVDATGNIAAVQPGTSTVTIQLRLQDQLLANATRTVRVTHVAEPSAESSDEGIEAESESAIDEPSADAADDLENAEAGVESDPLAGQQLVERPTVYEAERPLIQQDAAQQQPRPQIVQGEADLGESDESAPEDTPETSPVPIISTQVQIETADEELGTPSAVEAGSTKEDSVQSEQSDEQQDVSLSGEDARDELAEEGEIASDQNEPSSSEVQLFSPMEPASLLSTLNAARASLESGSMFAVPGHLANNLTTTINTNGGFYYATWSTINENGGWVDASNKNGVVFQKAIGQTEGNVTIAHCGGGNLFSTESGSVGDVRGRFHTHVHKPEGAPDDPDYTVVPGSASDVHRADCGAMAIKYSVSKAGYNFAGWYTDKALTKKYTGSSAGLDGKTIYAKWTANTYKIEFDQDGGTGGHSKEAVTMGKALPTLSKKPSWEHREFLGYWTKKNQSGDKYYDKDLKPQIDTFTAVSRGQSPNTVAITLYAAWKMTSYTLSLNGNGGTIDGASTKTIKYDYKTTSISLPTPKRDGWTFAGWKMSGLSGSIYTMGTPYNISSLSGPGLSGNATLTAQWRCTVTIKQNTPPSASYTVVDYLYYYLDYGFHETAMLGSTIAGKTYKRIGDKVITPPSKGGYTFHGYGPSGSITHLINSSGNLQVSSVGGPVTWQTDWSVNEYTITIDPAGGGMPSGATSFKYTTGQKYAPFYSGANAYWTPTRTNAEFVGWQCIASANTLTDVHITSGKVYPAFSLAADSYGNYNQYGNYTLQAVWRFDITLDDNAPTYPSNSGVTRPYDAICYYTGHGYRTSRAATGSSWPSGGFLNSGDSLFERPPICYDTNWVFDGYAIDQYANTTTLAIDKWGRVTSSYVPTGHTTFYAKWAGAQYTVTLQPNPKGTTGASQSGTTSIKYAYGMLYPASTVVYCLPGCNLDAEYGGIQIPIPTKSGWIFEGYYDDRGTKWYYACSHGTKHLATFSYHSSEGIYPAGNLTLTAKWVRNINVDANGGTAGKSTTFAVEFNKKMLDPLTNDYFPTKGPTNSPKDATWTFEGFSSTGGDKDTENTTVFFDAKGKRVYDENISTTTTPTSPIRAIWTRKITIDPNGGTGGQASVRAVKGHRIDAIGSRPEREGYTLQGFTTEKNKGDTVHAKDGTWNSAEVTTATCPSTIYASWKANSAYISFDANAATYSGASGGPATLEGKTALEITDRTLPTAVPTCPNYTFRGWYTDKVGGSKIEQLPEAYGIGTITYYAQYDEKPKSQVTFTVKGDARGSGHLEGPAWKGASISFTLLPDTDDIPFHLSAVADTAYEFIGWYEGETKRSDNAYWKPERPESGWPSAVTYTAKFKQKTYTISYSCAVCGLLSFGPTNPCRHIASAMQDLPHSFTLDDVSDGNMVIVGAPTMKPYYEFTGWTGRDAIPGSFQSTPITTIGNKELTVNSQPVQYKLHLDMGFHGGEIPEEYRDEWPPEPSTGGSQHVRYRTYTVETPAFQIPQPKRGGHTFNGWKIVDTGVGGSGVPHGPTFTPGISNYGNKTLVAQWSSNPYQITYDLSDDRGAQYGAGFLPEGADNPFSYDYDASGIVLPIAGRMGYDFTGWTEEEVLDDDPPSGLPGDTPQPVIVGDKPQIDVRLPWYSWGHRTYKAHWRPHRYTVEYDLDGGVWADSSADSVVAIYDEDLTLAGTPKRTGYIFRGWQLVRDTDLGQVTERFDAGQTVTRPNWVAQMGTRADQRADDPVGSVTLEAVWTPNLSADMIVGADGVHMSIALKGGTTREPFETTDGTAVLRNRSDGALKVVSVTPNATSDYDALKAEALQLFREEGAMQRAQFTVRPSIGNAATLQTGSFGIATAAGGLTLVDDTAYSSPDVDASGPNHARNWMMQAAGTGNDELRLIYHLDMGTLQPNDIDLSGAGGAQLHVADLVYKVALVLP